MSRKLATIRQIKELHPIPNKDRIELAIVDGWNVIVQKDLYKVGDLVIYCEIDSILPERKEFEFLRSKKFRIKTIKMGGAISQGICFPLEILRINTSTLRLGDDVTELMGIKKYIPKFEQDPKSSSSNKKYKNKFIKYLLKFKIFRWLLLNNKKKSNKFPDIVSKTDEPRCLVGNTKIITNKGNYRIADIVNKKMKIKIKSYNLNLNKIEYKNIIDYQKLKTREDLLKITFPLKNNTNRTNSIICSKDHKFYTPNGYKEANKLRNNDVIYNIDKCYSDDIMPFIYGMVLGDSRLVFENRLIKNGKHNNNIKIGFTQGYKQLEYLKFKQQIFGKDNFKIRKGKSGYTDNDVYNATLKMDKNISKNLNNLFIKNRKKYITQEFAEKLTPISLAFWYMNNGTLRHKNSKKNSPRINLCSYSFTKEENEILVDTLKNKFNIDCNIQKDRKYYGIYITTKGTVEFLKLISKYIHPVMRYKTLKEFENVDFELKNVSFKKEECLLETKIINIETIKNNHFIYDITVEGNHNFFANKILTHNCQNLTHLLSNKKISYIAREKINGQSSTFLLEYSRLFSFFKIFPPNKLTIASRNITLHNPDPASSYAQVVQRYDIKNVMKQLRAELGVRWVALQGECISPKVQGNMYSVSQADLYIFNLITPNGKMNCLDAEPMVAKYGLKWCPLVATNYSLPDTVDEIVDYASGQSKIADCMREGLVFRNYEHGISFKAVSNEFLLKYE